MIRKLTKFQTLQRLKGFVWNKKRKTHIAVIGQHQHKLLTLDNNICQAVVDNRFMELTFENGTFPCSHWIELLSRQLQKQKKKKKLAIIIQKIKKHLSCFAKIMAVRVESNNYQVAQNSITTTTDKHAEYTSLMLEIPNFWPPTLWWWYNSIYLPSEGHSNREKKIIPRKKINNRTYRGAVILSAHWRSQSVEIQKYESSYG